MKDKELINEIYENIADELNISDSVFKTAEKSYKALGKYLDDNIVGIKLMFFHKAL